MRLFTIILLSLLGFFVLFWALHPVLGDSSAYVAAFMMYIGFPMLLLRKWESEWQGPVIKACNYLLAISVITIGIWLSYMFGIESLWQSKFIIMCLFCAVYYIFVGRFPINLKNENT